MTVRDWLARYEFKPVYVSENDWLRAFEEFKKALREFKKKLQAEVILNKERVGGTVNIPKPVYVGETEEYILALLNSKK